MANRITQTGAPLGASGSFTVKTFCYLNNQLGINQFTYAYTRNGDEGMTCGNAAFACNIRFRDLFDVILPVSAQYLGCKVTINNIGGPTLMPGIAYDEKPGLTDAQPAPLQLSAVTKWTTAISSRSTRGRTFWPFMPVEALDGGQLNPDWVTKYTTAANDIKTFVLLTSATASYSLSMQVLSRKTASINQVLTGETTNRIATQRRRGSWGRTNQPVIT